MNLGNFDLTILSDGTYPIDGGAFFGVVPKVLWSRRMAPNDRNYITAGLNSLLIRTGDSNVLVETGIGSKLPEKLLKIHGQPAKLLDNLSAAGLAPDDIDIVINTHLHFDHCGWNTMRQADRIVPTFPKATYYVQEGEWQHARLQLERDAISYISPNYDPLVESGKMELLRGDQEIVPGIAVRVLPGHTGNMQAVVVTSAGQTACYISDLIPTAAHIDLTWVMAYDVYPLQTIESRKRYYAEALPGRWLTVFTHDHTTPWGYIGQEAGRMTLTIPTKL